MYSPDAVSKNMKLLRLLSDMTVGETAEALHISRQTLARYERGDISPDTGSLIAFSRLLGMPFTVFTAGSDRELEAVFNTYSGLSTIEKQFVLCYRNMSDFQRGYLFEVAAKRSVTAEDEAAGSSGRESEETASVRRNDP